MSHGSVRCRATKPWRILIVDDHALLRAGLTELLSQECDLEVCGEADGVSVALARAREQCPDLAVVDLTLREGHGMELIGKLRRLVPATRVLVFSMHDERFYADRARGEGAVGYVNKQEPASKVVQAVRAVLAGHTYFGRQVRSKRRSPD